MHPTVTVAWRAVRSFALAACAAAACVASAGCRSVTLAPKHEVWITSESRDEARWRSGDVEVLAPLHPLNGQFPLEGTLLNHGSGEVRVSFAPRQQVADDLVLGEVLAEREGSSQPILRGAAISVPPGTESFPGTLRFRLRADSPWDEAWPPGVGSTGAYDLTASTSAGDVSCPFAFTVSEVGEPITESWEVQVLLGVILVVAYALFGLVWFISLFSGR